MGSGKILELMHPTWVYAHAKARHIVTPSLIEHVVMPSTLVGSSHHVRAQHFWTHLSSLMSLGTLFEPNIH